MRVKIMGCSPLLGDHLGSTSMATDDYRGLGSEMRYSAFGEIRYDSGTMTTNYLYTGQRQEAEIGLYHYVSRWYDPAIGRFIQADSIVPNPGNAKGYDRYAYTYNNPIMYTDPSGHSATCIMMMNEYSGYLYVECSAWIEDGLLSAQTTQAWTNGLNNVLDVNADYTVKVYDSIPGSPNSNATYEGPTKNVINIRADRVGTIEGFGSFIHEAIHQKSMYETEQLWTVVG